MKGKRTEMKNNLQGVNSRAHEAKYQICNLEYKGVKNTHTEMKAALGEIKKRLHGPTVEGMKLRIKSMIWNIWKQKTTTQNKK